MSKPKDPAAIPISSKRDDLTYNKQSSADKRKAMGGNDLIQRKFYGDCDD
jgi:hypothetical protein